MQRTIRILLGNGNHVCMEDRFGVSTFDHLKMMLYPVHEVRDKTLQCLAAAVIANSIINHDELPSHLKEFIYQHEYQYPSRSPSLDSSFDSS